MNNQKSNNSVLQIIIIILLIILIAIGGVLLLNNKSKDNNSSDLINSDIQNDSDNIADNENKNEKSSVIILEPIDGVAVMYKGNVYVNVYDSTLTIDQVYGEGKYQKLISTRNNYKDYDFGSLNVSTKFIFMGGSNKWLKLDVSDVKAIYNNNYGQALSSMNVKYGILMQKNDNTVSYISISSIIDGDTSVINLNVSNINSIITEDYDGYITYLIDKNGTKTDVNNYIE